MGNPVKTFLKATAAVGLSFWLAACATNKAPANDQESAPDPDAKYEHSNSPFNPPFVPSRNEEKEPLNPGGEEKKKEKDTLDTQHRDNFDFG